MKIQDVLLRALKFEDTEQVSRTHLPIHQSRLYSSREVTKRNGAELTEKLF